MYDWISTKERLPADFISVIGHMTDAGIFPSERECYLVKDKFYFPALDEFHPVDYWMQFPEPPRKEQL